MHPTVGSICMLISKHNVNKLLLDENRYSRAHTIYSHELSLTLVDPLHEYLYMCTFFIYLFAR